MSPNTWLLAVMLISATVWSAEPEPGSATASSTITKRIDDRLQATLAELGEGNPPLGCAAQWVYRGVFAPSFAPPLMVSVLLNRAAGTEDGAVGGTVEVVTMVGAPQKGKDQRTSRHQTPLSKPLARDLAAQFDAIAPGTLQDSVTSGLDGMSLWGSVCGPGAAQVTFASWSPDPSTRHGQFFRALLEIARKVETDEPCLFAAENALTYLTKQGELIYADPGGNPRIIRLTSVSGNQAEAFRALVKSVSPQGDLIIDLRNFSGAGTMFIPEFKALDHRQGRTEWVMVRAGWDYLSRTFGVSRTHLVDSMAEAQRRLR